MLVMINLKTKMTKLVLILCFILIIKLSIRQSLSSVIRSDLAKRQIVNILDKSIIIMPKSYSNGMDSLKAAGLLNKSMFYFE